MCERQNLPTYKGHMIEVQCRGLTKRLIKVLFRAFPKLLDSSKDTCYFALLRFRFFHIVGVMPLDATYGLNMSLPYILLYGRVLWNPRLISYHEKAVFTAERSMVVP